MGTQPQKTVALYTLGCKVNQSESQAIIDAFRHRGWQAVSFEEPASVYIINTCTVTQAADQKSGRAIRRVKKRAPEALLVVTGCFAENKAAKLQSFPEIDMVLGNGQKDMLPELVEEAWERKNGAPDEMAGETMGEEPDESAAMAFCDGHKAEALAETDTAPLRNAALRGLDRTRATIKLQDGCRQYCSYCIIPYVRKEWYSMPMDEVLRRVGIFAETGYREVVLLGIHLGAYEHNSFVSNSQVSKRSADGKPYELADVLECLLNTYPAVRFRLGSLEPMEATERLIALIRDYPNACKHLHLPLQSGADGILRAMNRPYCTQDYREKIRLIRELVPDIALTTDIMVGFPGEGEEEFHQCMAFSEEMAFSRTHVFAYSRREGTPAADMPGQISKATKEKRSAELIRLGEIMGERYGERWIGRQQWVLIEDEIGDGSWIGHSDNYLEVEFTPLEGFCTQRNDVINESIKGCLLPLRIVGRSALREGAWQGELDVTGY